MDSPNQILVVQSDAVIVAAPAESPCPPSLLSSNDIKHVASLSPPTNAAQRAVNALDIEHHLDQLRTALRAQASSPAARITTADVLLGLDVILPCAFLRAAVLDAVELLDLPSVIASDLLDGNYRAARSMIEFLRSLTSEVLTAADQLDHRRPWAPAERASAVEAVRGVAEALQRLARILLATQPLRDSDNGPLRRWAPSCMTTARAWTSPSVSTSA